jgi:prepilin-type N-terminal cleavage/methylation domain-containing protein
MFMYLQKNKKGFTLIELMVVVAIIGILALLGLRVYSGQQDKAKAAIVKGNAGTIQTIIQSELADLSPSDVNGKLNTATTGIFAKSGIRNPFTNDAQTASAETEGMVSVRLGTADEEKDVFFIQAHGKGGEDLYTPALTARR